MFSGPNHVPTHQLLAIRRRGFIHFGSSEALQLELLDAAAELAGRAVVEPGLARLRRLFELWLGWVNTDAETARLLLNTELEDGSPVPIEGHPGLVAIRPLSTPAR